MEWSRVECYALLSKGSGGISLAAIEDLITVTTQIYMEFLRSFLISHFEEKPVVASQKVGRFLRLFKG